MSGRSPHVGGSRASARLDRARRAVAVGVAALATGALGLSAASCGLTLGAEPFACADGKTCPDGYTCQANVCLQAGQHPTITRALRITYINRSEMYWFASPQGGATLLVNDGFSPGARGVYEVHVATDGKVTPPIMLLPFPGEQTVSSAAIAIDDTHYGLVTMSFPGALDDGLSIKLHSLPRDGSAPPSDTILRDDRYTFAGGYEPAYVGGIVRGDEIDYAFTDPGQGGGVVVTRTQKDGTLVGKFRIPLPQGVQPLSGDCLLWKTTDGRVMLRLGLGPQNVYTLDLDKGTATLASSGDGVPLYGFGSSIAYMVANDDVSQVTFTVRDLAGNTLGSSPTEPYNPNVDPYTAVAFGTGALVAPVTSDPSFKKMEVAYIGSDGGYRHVASVDRPGDDALYSARSFATGSNVYLAWTSFHEQLMDLWVAVAPLGALP